ncbi:alanine racemase [bacterium]|nr:alanine racemase [candidate division CSSED10-310 bacterium]
MRLTWAEIDIEAIEHNLRTLRHTVHPAKIIAIVKANAYGHGIVRVARAAVDAGADYLGVGFLEEGMLLRRRGFSTPILVLGGVLFHQVHEFIINHLDLTVSSLGLAYAVNREAEILGKIARIHLKFDTGFNRIGMHYAKASDIFERLKPLKNIDIVGIYSHFATADDPATDYTGIQFDRFQAVLEAATRWEIAPTYRHIACSGAILYHSQTFCNMVRVGLAMYGLYPTLASPRVLDLKPVLSFKSRVVFLKTLPPGEPVSYGGTFVTSGITRVATIPVGYGDGYTRRLSNNADVLIRGKRFPVIGNICMDQIMVNLGDDATVEVGDEVVLYGRQGNECIPVEEIARRADTIPYEITTWLARRVPRVCINTKD